MYLGYLGLSNFRNYSSLQLELEAGPVVLYGSNAQGKSNFLEAVYMLATTKSSRAGMDREMIGWDSGDGVLSVARLVGDVHRREEKVRLEIALGSESPAAPSGQPDGPQPYLRKQIKVNGVARRASDAMGRLNVVLFTTQDVELVSGSPSVRRRYLDITNSQVDPAYLRALQRYTRILTQRNSLLRLIREGSAHRDELQVWDGQLVDEGSRLLFQRKQMIEEINLLAQVIHSELSASAEDLRIAYLPNPPGLEEEGVDWGSPEGLKEVFHRELAARRDREVAQGMSVTGPHRDDLRFLVNGTDMAMYGSRGQQRTIVAAVKLAEANFLVRKTGEDPVLLLDDILSELDESRRKQVLDSALTTQQTILTTTDLDRVDSEFLSRARVYRVRQGELEMSQRAEQQM